MVGFVRTVAPEPRRRLRDLERGRGRGDSRALEGPWQDYARLRVGPYRVILRYRPRGAEWVYAERRSIVYEVFADAMIERLARAR